jgi:low temperature requirement protein LtrA
MSERPEAAERPVVPLELFFDLVFVFAFTQVTTLLSHEPTWRGLGRALLVLAVLWWAWTSYAWLTNAVDPEQGAILGALIAATGALFVAALAVPEAFGDESIVFGVAFLMVGAMQATLFALSSRGDPELLHAVLRLAPWVVGGSALILVAGLVDGRLRPALWVTALVVGFVGPGFAGVRGWSVQTSHFVERHGLIVIIAIGESLVAIGIGARGIRLDGSVIVAALLGFVVATSYWLAYFDFFSIRVRRLLDEREGEERIALARDIFTYLHLPMVAGIVLFAFALKVTLAHRHAKLGAVEALALCGGPALFLTSFVVLRLRISRTLSSGRLAATLAFVLLVPVALHVPAVAALALVASVWVALHAYELVWWRTARAETRLQRFRDRAGE